MHGPAAGASTNFAWGDFFGIRWVGLPRSRRTTSTFPGTSFYPSFHQPDIPPPSGLCPARRLGASPSSGPSGAPLAIFSFNLLGGRRTRQGAPKEGSGARQRKETKKKGNGPKDGPVCGGKGAMDSSFRALNRTREKRGGGREGERGGRERAFLSPRRVFFWWGLVLGGGEKKSGRGGHFTLPFCRRIFLGGGAPLLTLPGQALRLPEGAKNVPPFTFLRGSLPHGASFQGDRGRVSRDRTTRWRDSNRQGELEGTVYCKRGGTGSRQDSVPGGLFSAFARC